jgi:4-hydroxy-tetrahydrodipicolinate reductase
MTLRVAVAGASGRMGRMLIEAVEAAPDCMLAGTLDIGRDVAAGLADAQVLIDFTRPEGTMAHLAACAERHRAEDGRGRRWCTRPRPEAMRCVRP